MGRVTMLIAPTMTVSNEITIATIGRLMKNFDTLASHLRRLSLDDRDDRAFSHFQQAFDDDAFTSLDTGRDDPEVADAVADDDRTDRDLAVVANDCDLMTALQLGHGALR